MATNIPGVMVLLMLLAGCVSTHPEPSDPGPEGPAVDGWPEPVLTDERESDEGPTSVGASLASAAWVSLAIAFDNETKEGDVRVDVTWHYRNANESAPAAISYQFLADESAPFQTKYCAHGGSWRAGPTSSSVSVYVNNGGDGQSWSSPPLGDPLGSNDRIRDRFEVVPDFDYFREQAGLCGVAAPVLHLVFAVMGGTPTAASVWSASWEDARVSWATGPADDAFLHTTREFDGLQAGVTSPAASPYGGRDLVLESSGIVVADRSTAYGFWPQGGEPARVVQPDGSTAEVPPEVPFILDWSNMAGSWRFEIDQASDVSNPDVATVFGVRYDLAPSP